MADPARTEKATPRRRQEARERGQVARSTEINTVVILLAAVLTFRYAGGYMVGALGEVTAFSYRNLGVSLGPDNIHSYGMYFLLQIALVIAPVLAAILVVGLLANYLQVGVLFTTHPLEPKVTNINPATGFKRIFSKRSMVEFIKALLKIGVVGWVAYVSVRDALPQLIPAMDMSGMESLKFIGSLTAKVMVRIILVLMILALLDYLYQKWEYEENLKMTKQEVRDELRQSEGDPLIKARIRQIQREMARRRMFEAVPQADVVVTNPVHVAVAIRYKDDMKAPQVVAKGERVVAERIKETAKKNGVPVVENPPLARALFKSCPVGAEIPGDLYEAVAELLAFVYRASKKGVA